MPAILGTLKVGEITTKGEVKVIYARSRVMTSA